MKDTPSKLDRIRMHWICLRRDCHHAWFHIKGIGREFCQRKHQRQRAAARYLNACRPDPKRTGSHSTSPEVPAPEAVCASPRL